MPIRRIFIVFLLLWTACSDDAPSNSTAETGASEESNAALAEAAFQGDTAAVKALLADAQIDAVDEGGRSALMLAAYDGHADTVSLLCEKKADPNLQDVNQRTALMYAASGPNLPTVEILLAHGAEVNVTDGDEGWTALMFAAAEGHADIVQMLLDKGSSPDIADVDGETALTFATNNGHADVVKLLQR